MYMVKLTVERLLSSLESNKDSLTYVKGKTPWSLVIGQFDQNAPSYLLAL